MPDRGMAEFDRQRGNFLERIRNLEEELEKVKRWAAPISGGVLLPNPPGLKAWRTTAQSIPTATQTIVTSLTDALNEDGLELESGNIIKLRRDSTIEYYLFWVHAQFAANTTGVRRLGYSVRNINTGGWSLLNVAGTPAMTGGLATYFAVPILHVLDTLDDAIRFEVYQDSGGNLNLNLFLVNGIMVKSGDVFAA